MDAAPISDGLFARALAFRIVFDVAGGMLLCVVSAIAMWNAGPHWYPLGLAASALPSAWLGARIVRARAW